MKLLENAVEALAKATGANYAEDLFPMLKPNSNGKTKLWTYLPSKFIGEYRGGWYVSYTNMMTLYKKKGPEACKEVLAYPGRDGFKLNYYMKLFPEAFDNVRKITGETDMLGVFGNEHGWCRINTPELRAWAKVNRGRDLFIPGLGTFDIAQAVRSCLAEGKSLKVEELQCMGYYGDFEAAGMLSSKRWQPHLIKYKAQWKIFGFGHRYEFGNCSDTIGDLVHSGDYMNYPPAELYAHIQAGQEQRRLEYVKSNCVDVNRPFPEQPETILYEEYILEPARDKETLKYWGQQMNTCVGGDHYARNIIANVDEIWMLRGKPGHDVPAAVVQLNKRTRRVAQAKGIKNSAIGKRVREVIDVCLRQPFLKSSTR